ncbi:MAG TPA: glycosyltransferase [Thermoanaerobaculia bacterium]|nr:glycosyltransferase [Thermoanaerobaculia bacterium]
MRRIAVFTHDTFGLGHVRRCLHIVRGLCAREPHAAVLLITGSPAAQAMRDLPPNADFLKLPTVAKTGDAARRPPHLPIGPRAITSIRKRLVRGAIESFRPDLLLVDNFPLGSRRELLPALERCRELGVRTVLGLRDVVDRPEVVRETWARDDVYRVLRELYDLVLVYGSPEILDVGEAYALDRDLRSKLRYCGYVTAIEPASREPRRLLEELGLAPPLVVASAGGGGDGYPLLSSFVRAVRLLEGVSALAITGPLMARQDRERLRRQAAGEPRIVIEEYVSDLPSYLRAADAVVAMGGYNTVAELLALRRRALVLPRNWRYGEFLQGPRAGIEWEQLLRAQALERFGLLRVLSSSCFEPAALAQSIAGALSEPDPVGLDWPVRVDGVERAVDQLLETPAMEDSRAQG